MLSYPCYLRGLANPESAHPRLSSGDAPGGAWKRSRRYRRTFAMMGARKASSSLTLRTRSMK